MQESFEYWSDHRKRRRVKYCVSDEKVWKNVSGYYEAIQVKILKRNNKNLLADECIISDRTHKNDSNARYQNKKLSHKTLGNCQQNNNFITT